MIGVSFTLRIYSIIHRIKAYPYCYKPYHKRAGNGRKSTCENGVKLGFDHESNERFDHERTLTLWKRSIKSKYIFKMHLQKVIYLSFMQHNLIWVDSKFT